MYNKHSVISAKTTEDRKEKNMITLSYTGYHMSANQVDIKIHVQMFMPTNR